MRCKYCGCEVWMPKGDQKTIVCDCARTEHPDPCYAGLTAKEVAAMPLTVRHKIITMAFEMEDLEAEKVQLIKDLAEKQEQLDQTAHKCLDLKAENERLRDAIVSVESTLSYYHDRLGYAWIGEPRYELLKAIRPEQPKEQP